MRLNRKVWVKKSPGGSAAINSRLIELGRVNFAIRVNTGMISESKEEDNKERLGEHINGTKLKIKE